jgi:hypothetical protein
MVFEPNEELVVLDETPADNSLIHIEVSAAS